MFTGEFRDEYTSLQMYKDASRSSFAKPIPIIFCRNKQDNCNVVIASDMNTEWISISVKTQRNIEVLFIQLARKLLNNGNLVSEGFVECCPLLSNDKITDPPEDYKQFIDIRDMFDIKCVSLSKVVNIGILLFHVTDGTKKGFDLWTTLFKSNLHLDQYEHMWTNFGKTKVQAMEELLSMAEKDSPVPYYMWKNKPSQEIQYITVPGGQIKIEPTYTFIKEKSIDK